MDGGSSVRKQLKVRPGFTPQEDVGRFRGSRQQQFDRNQLPKGHILGWIAPSSERKDTNASAKAKTPGAVAGASGVGAGAGGEKPLTKSAAKNAKRKAKKQAEKEKIIKESWEDSDEDNEKEKKVVKSEKAVDQARRGESENATAAASGKNGVSAPDTEGDALAEELQNKLDVH